MAVFSMVFERQGECSSQVDRPPDVCPRPFARNQDRFHATTWPLLLLQLVLLAGFLVLCVSASPRIDPDAPTAILAGMLGVSAMAVQNALVQISLKGAPSTAVMTTNITRFRCWLLQWD
jgi:uncharacterized membrane protein YoaK (UPF0700 family)